MEKMKQIITKTIDIQGIRKGISIGIGILITLATSALIAVAVTGTINTFSSGGVVDASQINTNFASLKTAVEGITSSQWTTSGTSIYYNGGNVGIGTSSPNQQLAITGGIGFANQNSTDKKLYSPSDGVLEWMTNSAAGLHGFAVSNQGTQVVHLNTSGNSFLNGGNVGIGTTLPTALLHVAGTAGNNTGTWSNLSDERLKKNIFDYKGSLEKILNLRPVSFEWKENKEGRTAGRHIGFIAQEVEKVFPEWVSAMSDGNKWMTPEGMNAVLVGAIRDLKNHSDSVETHCKTSLREQGILNATLAKENASLKENIRSLLETVKTQGQASQRLEERLNALEKMQMAKK